VKRGPLRGLLAVQPKSFVATTDSHHEPDVCLNLASRMTLTGINQLWVADIAYIRLLREFVCLAVLLDGFSRKVGAGNWIERWPRACRLPLGRRRSPAARLRPV